MLNLKVNLGVEEASAILEKLYQPYRTSKATDNTLGFTLSVDAEQVRISVKISQAPPIVPFIRVSGASLTVGKISRTPSLPSPRILEPPCIYLHASLWGSSSV
ncbi:hypothetical protein P153DRAFT_85608 [Dothidotthia symphoricarpi CBS 119687]|uniref:Uncharacterized protein n=1 Tax=Dothidotthia symphoricarpi CBS 119687 TaxID=1392245 RepID=A0A6A6A5R8_9PLEO|nr:uncharacterized protein P153DRAFT_85608 [Dothidotthia symphoricarpi CBS 119687]KAF2126118.1 hypothetical protein P153DRAFT_85608 [Dothidotthia symphoricarpi CBS 119687]